MVGTLRPAHQDHNNSAAAFVRAKIQVVPSTDGDDWAVTAHRAEVLLPRGADDRFYCLRTLFEAIDAEHPVDGKALLTYVTLTWRPERLHAQWELGRRLALELVREHEVAVLAVQHVPGKVARSNDPHVHLAIAGPRTLGSLGFGPYVTALMGDRVWLPVRDRFRAQLAEAGELIS